VSAVAEQQVEPLREKAVVRVDKYEGDWTPEQIAAGKAAEALIESIEREDNLLVIGGASALWNRLIATTVTAFDNANAHLGVGGGAGSTTAAADTQTDLQGASKTRKAMDATYPLHTDTTGTAGSKSIVFRSTFATGDANHAWDEWGVFNAAAAGRMFNRKVEALGTKTAAATWVLTITLSLA
jgi:hypothetical protein